MNAPTIPAHLVEADEALSRLRVPPHSVEAEQSVLGGLLLDNLAWDRAGDLLTESDFYRHEHRLIFAAIGTLVTQNKPADVITAFELLQRQGKAEDVGGLAYLNALAQSVPSAANIRRYAEIMRERSVGRTLIATTNQANEIAWNEADHDTAHERIASLFYALDQRRTPSTPTLARDVVVDLLDEIQALAEGAEVPGLASGIPALDRLLGRFVEGLYILAARPSVGKSSLASQLALTFADSGASVLLMSLEMSRKQVVRRMTANMGRIPLDHLKTGQLDDDQWGRLSDAVERIGRLSLHIDDQPALRLVDVRRKVRAIRPKPDVILIDYLQRMSGNSSRAENRNLEIEAISSGLKTLSTELHCPVIALAQLSRKVEERADKRPYLSDLRDSGGIEQDADAVVLLWPVRSLPGEGNFLRGCSVAKSRDGAVGEFGLAFDGRLQRWVESTESIENKAQPGQRRGFE